MNSPKSDKELDEWLELLSSSTHSPQGKFSAEKSYNILQQRLQPAYRKHKILSIRYTVAVAAGFVLLIGFGWMFYFYQRPVRTLIVSTNIQTQCIQLPDGSKVTLNRHSQLSYPETFNKERIVKLNGEAYFEVETTLLEGSVSVSNNANGKQMILKPNETAIYRKSTGILSMHINANAQNEISWREGILSFNDISMGEIARQLSHHFNVTIQIKSEQLRNYKLNARFKQNETLEEILEMLAPIVGFTYHMPQSNLIELKQEN